MNGASTDCRSTIYRRTSACGGYAKAEGVHTVKTSLNTREEHLTLERVGLQPQVEPFLLQKRFPLRGRIVKDSRGYAMVLANDSDTKSC